MPDTGHVVKPLAGRGVPQDCVIDLSPLDIQSLANLAGDKFPILLFFPQISVESQFSPGFSSFFSAKGGTNLHFLRPLGLNN